MKKLLLVAVAVMTFAACSDEKTGWGDPHKPDVEQMGYLNLADDALSVIIEQEVGNTEVGSGAESETRAGETNFVEVTANDGYYIYIIDKDGNTVSSFSYADWCTDKANVPEYVEEDANTPYVGGKKGIKLPVGTYTVKATSKDVLSNVSFEPEYEGSTQVTIGKAEEKTVNVECSLASVKVTVKFDEILADLIKIEGTKVAAKLGDVEGKISEHTFEGPTKEEKYETVTDLTTESDPVYLLPQNVGEGAQNPLNLYLTTVYDGNAINGQVLPVTKDAKRGEWRNITIKLEHGDQGTINFVVTVETIVYNETVVVDVQTYASNILWGESSIPDFSDAPYFESVHYDLEKAINPSSMFNSNDEYVGPLMNLKSKSAVTAVYITATSTNAELNNALKDIPTTNLMEATNVMLSSWGIPNGSNAFTAATSDAGVPFSFKGFVEMIKGNDNYAGLHSFTFKVEAGAGCVSETTVQIGTSDRDPNAPVVIWDGGKLNELITLTADTKLKLIVETSENSTIESLIINIEGGIAGLLGGVGMPSEFDLVDPDLTKPGLSVSLGGNGIPGDENEHGFGFPVKDEVKGMSCVEFTIGDNLKTLMLGQLSGLDEKTAIFRLTVTDSEGRVNTGGDAMMLKVE